MSFLSHLKHKFKGVEREKQKLLSSIQAQPSQQSQLSSQIDKGCLIEYLSAPLPNLTTPINEIPLLALDFETTGLDAKDDKLLSVGFCQLDHRNIRLASSYHQVINTQAKLKADNVAIHQITDDQRERGEPLQTVVEHLLSNLVGRVALVHYHHIEMQFLAEACQLLYGVQPPFMWIDTMLIAKRKLDNRDVGYDPSQLRLAAQRQAFELPPYAGHNALNDAIATAELYLAQTNKEASQLVLADLLV